MDFSTYIAWGPLVSVLLFLIARWCFRRSKAKIVVPTWFTLSVFPVYAFAGYLSLGFVIELAPFVQMDIDNSMVLFNVGWAVLLLAMLLGTSLLRSKVRTATRQDIHLARKWNAQALKKIVVGLTVFFWISALAYFISGGTMLLFQPDPQEIYTTFGRDDIDNPLVVRSFYTSLFLLLLVSGLHLIVIPERNRLSRTNLVVAITFYGLSGGRTTVFLLGLTLFFYFLIFERRASIRPHIIKIGIVLICFMLFSVIVILFRHRDLLLDPYQLGYAITSLSLDYVSYARILYQFPDGVIFDKSLVINTIIYPAFPQQFWALIGVDKMASWVHPGLEYARLLGGVPTGAALRINTIGELYMDFGLTGVMLGMAFVGLLLAVINSQLTNRPPESPWNLMLCFWLAVFSVGLVGSAELISAHFYEGSAYVFILVLLASRLSAQGGGPEGFDRGSEASKTRAPQEPAIGMDCLRG